MVKILAATGTILAHVHYGFRQFFQTNARTLFRLRPKPLHEHNYWISPIIWQYRA